MASPVPIEAVGLEIDTRLWSVTLARIAQCHQSMQHFEKPEVVGCYLVTNVAGQLQVY